MSSSSPAPTPSSTFFSQKQGGWTAGAGAEIRLGGNWTGKVEYLYLDFGNVSTTAVLPTIRPTRHHIQFTRHGNLVRVGLNYKFDPSGRSTLHQRA
jgi:outer membrane immunogenic protein